MIPGLVVNSEAVYRHPVAPPLRLACGLIPFPPAGLAATCIVLQQHDIADTAVTHRDLPAVGGCIEAIGQPALLVVVTHQHQAAVDDPHLFDVDPLAGFLARAGRHGLLEVEPRELGHGGRAVGQRATCQQSDPCSQHCSYHLLAHDFPSSSSQSPSNGLPVCTPADSLCGPGRDGVTQPKSANTRHAAVSRIRSSIDPSIGPGCPPPRCPC